MPPFAALTLIWTCSPLADDPVWAKPEVRRELAAVVKALEACHGYGVNGKPVVAVSESLDKLLDTVGETEAARIAKDERRFSAKLVAIALDRRKNPDLYDELGKAYGDHERRDSRPEAEWKRAEGSRAGIDILERLGTDDKHLDEKYRLAWEFRLLVLPRLREIAVRGGRGNDGYYEGRSVPGVGSVRHLCRHLTADAVLAVHDERTLVTQIEAYKLSVRSRLPNDDEVHFDCFVSLSAHETQQGLRAILDWAEWTEGVWKEQITDKGYRVHFKFTPTDLVKGLAEKDADHWLRIAEKLPTDGLTVREKELRAALITECRKR